MKKIVRRSGFTLPEILVTVTVIAVLAAVAVPAVTQFAGKGDAPATQQDIAGIRNAVSGFATDVRKFPLRLSELVNTTVTTADSSIAGTGVDTLSAADVANFKGPYLQANATVANGFTSSGLGLTLSDRLIVTSGWLQDSITTPASFPCATALHLDTLLDKGDGASSGSFVWLPTTCTQASPTGSVTALIRITSVGQ